MDDLVSTVLLGLGGFLGVRWLMTRPVSGAVAPQQPQYAPPTLPYGSMPIAPSAQVTSADLFYALQDLGPDMDLMNEWRVAIESGKKTLVDAQTAIAVYRSNPDLELHPDGSITPIPSNWTAPIS